MTKPTRQPTTDEWAMFHGISTASTPPAVEDYGVILNVPTRALLDVEVFE